MRITGIDIGQVGGFSKLNTDPYLTLEWGSFEARRGRGEGEGAMYVRLQNRLDEVLADRPDLVPFESVDFVAPKRRGALQQVRMCGIVQMRCEQLGLNYVGVANNTLKKFATGNGRAEKWQMEAALESWWQENLSQTWPGGRLSSHEVDAVWVAIWGWKVHAPTLVELEF